MKYHLDYTSQEFKDLMEPAASVSHFFDSPLSFRVFKNAYIAPYYEWNHSIGCVLDKDGVAVKDSECIEWKENAEFYELDTAELEHKRVIYLGFLLTGFGHSYTDNLRKFWFLDTEEYKSMAAQGYELVFTTNYNHPLPDATLEVFRLAGVDLSDSRHITKLTRFDEIVIPDNSLRAMDYGRIYSSPYVALLDRIKDKIPDMENCPSKVYFTRTRFVTNSLKDYGEREIERVFSDLGYTVIAPEEHSVLQQLQILRGCDSFAATDGTVAHLSLFAKPKTPVTISVKANYLNFHQVMINELADLDVTYVEAHHSSKVNASYPWWGPFYMCINRYMERFVGHPLLHLPYWMRFSYWEYYSGYLLHRFYHWIRQVFFNLKNRLR